MPLNVISNFAANVAHRHLQEADNAATNSLAKLSAGKRVLSAKDDAASLAIGSRISAEVKGLNQASVNATQGISMLQIADGAMSRVNDILVRMKSLAVQAGSGQLSDTERGMLDTEFQALKSEIDRIAEDTEFNGNQLVSGAINTTGVGSNINEGAGVEGVVARGISISGSTTTGSLAYATASNKFSITLNSVTYTGTVSTGVTSGSSLTSATVVTLSDTAGSAAGQIFVQLDQDFDPSTAISASNTVSLTGSDTLSLDFKVGTGSDANADVVSVSVESLSTASLGISSDNVTTASAADTASANLTAAIDALQTSRASVGASQNRLEFAAANIATARENQEAARSGLLDLDVAQEMSNFTSKQILVQAGVSMLAQANQLPQNLLALFQ